MGSGTNVNTDDIITAAKMNLKLESVVNADVSVGANIVGSKLATNARRQFAHADSTLNLNAAAVSNIIILHADSNVTLLKASLLYTVASTADAGVNVNIGNKTNAAYYYTGLSTVNQNVWNVGDCTLLNTDVAAGDTVICGTTGTKLNFGTVLPCIEFMVND